MAIWQIKLTLLPVEGLIRIHGSVPNELDDFRPATLETNFDEIEWIDYWDSENAVGELREEAAKVFSECCELPEEQVFGQKSGNSLVVRSDDVQFRWDVRAPDLEILDSVLRIARKFQCVVVWEETGEVLQPEMLDVLEKAKTSKALRFVVDPKNCLSDIGRMQSNFRSRSNVGEEPDESGEKE